MCGSWGRLDMALFLFARAILAGEPIEVFNHGYHHRSFTDVDDIAEGVVRVMEIPSASNPGCAGAAPDPATSGVAPYRLFNVGNDHTVALLRYIEVLKECLGKKAKMGMLPLQPGDVPDIEADVSDLATVVHYCPQMSVEVGVRKFVDWHREYYGESNL